MTTFHDLPSALEAGVANVRRLIVDANRTPAWESWPDELWTLTELEELRLNQGRLSRVPSAIGRLTKLRVLELAFSFQFFEPGLGELASLRELIIRGPQVLLKPDLAKLSLERLTIAADWTDSAPIIARIPVTKNVTLTDNHPLAAEDLEREDLSAWRDLEELEIDAWEDFEPTVFARKLPRCGFAINRKRRVDWMS